MCGRFTLKTPASSWVEQLFAGIRFLDLPENPPRYNIAPTQPILAIVQTENGHKADWFRWGLVPGWADDPAIGNKMINARSETLSEKPSFRRAFEHRRCLIVADGYFEWRKLDAKTKKPYWIHRPDDQPFLMAGLWEINRKIDTNQPLISATIITTSANQRMALVHDRMPVILERDESAFWADPSHRNVAELQKLLKPAEESYLQLRPVSSLVNNPRNDSPECIVPTSSPEEIAE